MPVVPPISALPPESADPSVVRRLRRLRWLAWVLDGSIPVGPWRIGIDPLLGLIPGVGDWLGAVASGYIVYEAARLGVPGAVLLRMIGNVLLETLIGLVPVLGDAFDFAWKANLRNLELIDRHHGNALSTRPAARIGMIAGLLLLAALAGFLGLLALLVNVVRGFLH